MRTIATLLFALLAGWLLVAWSTMLTVGIAHRDWWHFIPVIGYHAALAISFPGLVFGMLVAIVAEVIKGALR